MHWPVCQFRHFHSRRVYVVGLDVGPEGCHLAVLEGTLKRPIGVVWAEQLCLPDGWVVRGEVLQPLAFGRWLRAYFRAKGYQPEAVCINLNDASVSEHTVALTSGLSRDDVVFQLQAELQTLLFNQAQLRCVDFDVIEGAAEPEKQLYLVHAMPCEDVQAVQHMAEAAGWPVLVVAPRRPAVASPCGTAYLAALGAWRETAVNFLQHRSIQDLLVPRLWWWHVGLSVASGGCLAVIAIGVLSCLSDVAQEDAAEVVASARAYEEAQQAHRQANATQERGVAQLRWVQSRQSELSQSSQWHRVLSQSAQGVWVVRVKQHGARWTVEGEALSPEHVQQLREQLKALDIWMQVPELQQLQILPAVARTGLPVWQFRLEADLKVGR